MNLTYSQNVTLMLVISSLLDTSFRILMPASFSCAADCFNISATTEATADVTDYISFNFTSGSQSNVQPYRKGDSTLNQNGAVKPIFLVQNTGNRSISIDLRLNASFPTGVTISANATCTPVATGCTSTTTSKTTLTTSYQNFVIGLKTSGSYANITFWGDITTAVAPGEYSEGLFTNSSKS